MEAIRPNPWNPNRLEGEKYKKLADAIRERGFLAPILVRPAGDRFEIIDGEHRFRIARELGLSLIPAVVTELSDLEARIKTLQLNGLRGENDPDRLAALLEELSRKTSPENLSRVLPWSSPEIQAMLDQARKNQPHPDQISEGIKTIQPPALELYAVVVRPEQRRIIEEAVAGIRRKTGIKDDGEALAELCHRRDPQKK